MDTGSKTLAQLSEENKEAKYVSLDVGSKISGYTKDYLERLCRLHKVTYKLWNNGVFVIELESLLRETQAILLSYEGVTFVDKAELTDPPPEAAETSMLSSASREVDTRVATQIGGKDMEQVEHQALAERVTREIPRFAEHEETKDNPFSFVGRAVVSDGKTQAAKNPVVPVKEAVKEAVKEPIKETEAPQKVAIKVKETVRETVKETPAVTPPVSVPTSNSVHMVIKPDNSESSSTAQAESSQVVLPPSVKKIAIVPDRDMESEKNSVPHGPTKIKIVSDDWDTMLLGKDTSPKAVSIPVTEEKSGEENEEKSEIKSPYRPIETSIDREVHNDPAPLFPVIDKKDAAALAPAPPALALPVMQKEVMTLAPPQQKVTVFAPKDAMPSITSSPIHAISEGGVEKSVSEMKAGNNAQNIVTKGLPSSVVMNTRIAAIESVIGTTSGPLVRSGAPSATLPSQERSRITSSPSAIPMNEEEHHLSIYEPHPLMKSTGFNAVFAVMILGASFFTLGTAYMKNAASLHTGGNENVAGAGAALDQNTRSQDRQDGVEAPQGKAENTNESAGALPFSNDITATSGEKANSVIVQPLFPGGAGKAYEFMIVPVAK